MSNSARDERRGKSGSFIVEIKKVRKKVLPESGGQVTASVTDEVAATNSEDAAVFRSWAMPEEKGAD